MDDNEIRSRVEAAGWILDAAKADGIPAPTGISIYPGAVTLVVEDRAALTRWASWRDLTVTPGPVHADGLHRNINAEGEMYEVHLRVIASEPVARVAPCACSHSPAQHSEIGCLASASGGRPCNCSRTPSSFTPVGVRA